MQRIKTTKWPSRNPYGDRLFYKPRFVFGTTLTIPTGAPYIQTLFSFNDMAAIGGLAGSAPGLSDLATAFTRYRVRGCKIKFTYWPDPLQNGVPVVGYFNAAQSVGQILVTPNVSLLPEQRWAKYRVLNQPGTGAKPTSLSVYYSANKVYGPDAVVKNDVSFTGGVGTGLPTTWSSPATAVPCAFGLCTMSGLNPTAAVSVVCKVEITPYLELFSKRLITV